MSEAQLEQRRNAAKSRRPGAAAWTRRERDVHTKTQRKLRELTDKAAEVLGALLEDEDPLVRKYAAAEILDRAGFPKRSELDVDGGAELAGPIIHLVLGNHPKPGTA